MLEVPEVRYTRVGDAHVAYQVVGEGPIDLLIAPGFISHLDLQWTMPTYVAFVERLASFGRVILFDKRGTGLSDPSAGAARFDQRVEDIEGVMDGAGSERAVLFGMSEGGPLATLFAATHPDGLVLHFRPYALLRDACALAGLEAPAIHPFAIPIDLPRPARDDEIISYTVPAADGGRILFRGALAQPWCHVVASRPG